jgi:hypothetical protein
MLEEFVGKRTELGSEGQKMIVILHLGIWYTEEWLSGDKLKDKAAEAPDISGFVDRSGKYQLGSSKTDGSNRLFWGVGIEICC